jgi:hypothetical protein
VDRKRQPRRAAYKSCQNQLKLSFQPLTSLRHPLVPPPLPEDIFYWKFLFHPIPLRSVLTKPIFNHPNPELPAVKEGRRSPYSRTTETAWTGPAALLCSLSNLKSLHAIQYSVHIYATYASHHDPQGPLPISSRTCTPRGPPSLSSTVCIYLPPGLHQSLFVTRFAGFLGRSREIHSIRSSL